MGFVEYSISPAYFSNLNELSMKVKDFLREKIPEWIFEGTLRIPGFFGRGNELRELYEKINDEKQMCNVVNVFGIVVPL